MRRFAQAFLPEALPPELPHAVAHALGQAPERYNIAVRKPASVIHDPGSGLAVADFTWGLVPSWSKLPETKYTTVTARLDRAPGSRIYRSAWEKRRCAVPLTGYYKWDRTTSPARPYFIQSRAGDVLFAAGLWDRWPAEEPELLTFTVLTMPNAAIPEPLVQDGPVFLPAAAVADWIAGPWLPSRFLTRMKQPQLEAYPVSRAIRSRDVDDYTLLEPADADSEPASAPDEDWIDEDDID
ncbi:SOS response-associated peptidase [Cognatilysobacter lacus]|uniref:Abasic site processing protein n=1 Tax=Cognatilysobacter lacus TaxID=1643323 RepID=A0A5D8Z9C4_9GAMM|nr:SOS response-associated peptidase [Lysobacter lacus]TZF91535.1 SOS response-associated peptidase [Lysobacter lacus]